MHLETFDAAVRKQNRAQETSDLSADETTNGRTTRHQRCRIELSDAVAEIEKKKRSKSNSTAKLPRIPVPAGLQGTGGSEAACVMSCDICTPHQNVMLKINND